MEIPLDEVATFDAITSTAAGAAVDADATPTFEVFEETTDTDIGVGGNFTKRTGKTGNYRASITLSAANGFEVGKFYNVIASATVGGVAAKARVANFRVKAAETAVGFARVDLAYILGTALTETSAGYLSAGFKKLFDVATPIFTLASGGLLEVWNVATSGMSTVGSIGKRIVDYLTGDIYARLGAPAGASVSADVAAVKSDSGAIKTQTDKLTFTVANQVDANVLDWKSSTAPAMTGDAYARLGAPAGASVSADVAALKVVADAVKAKTDNLSSDPADASDIAGAFSTVNSTLATIASYIDTEIAAIKAKTDNLPADPADASDIAASFSSIAATLTTLASYVDTEVAAIKAKTDTLPGNPAATGDAMTLTAAYDFAKGTAAMAESYAANGAAPSPIQALYALQQMLSMFAIVGTSWTIKKLDGVTTAFVITLDSATAPTAAARS